MGVRQRWVTEHCRYFYIFMFKLISILNQTSDFKIIFTSEVTQKYCSFKSWESHQTDFVLWVLKAQIRYYHMFQCILHSCTHCLRYEKYYFLSIGRVHVTSMKAWEKQTTVTQSMHVPNSIKVTSKLSMLAFVLTHKSKYLYV